jgi:hypothetical protein
MEKTLKNGTLFITLEHLIDYWVNRLVYTKVKMTKIDFVISIKSQKN